MLQPQITNNLKSIGTNETIWLNQLVTLPCRNAFSHEFVIPAGSTLAAIVFRG